jgi:hypothetical protein
MASNSASFWFVVVFAAGLIGFGMVTGWKALQSAILARKAANWPTAVAQIDRAEIREQFGSKGRRYYRVIVNYTYNVAGTDYEGTVISPMYSKSGSRADAEELLGQLQPGTSVQVSHDPVRPGEAVIVTGFLRCGAGALATSGLMILMGLFFLATWVITSLGSREMISRIVHP